MHGTLQHSIGGEPWTSWQPRTRLCNDLHSNQSVVHHAPLHQGNHHVIPSCSRGMADAAANPSTDAITKESSEYVGNTECSILKVWVFGNYVQTTRIMPPTFFFLFFFGKRWSKSQRYTRKIFKNSHTKGTRPIKCSSCDPKPIIPARH